MKSRRVVFLATSILVAAILVAVLVVLQPGAVAQEGNDLTVPDSTSMAETEHLSECKTLAKEYYDMLSNPPGIDSVLSLQCRVDAELVDTSLARESVNVLDIMLNNRRLVMKNKDFMLARDTGVVLFVLPYTQTVHLYTASVAEDPSKEMLEFLSARDDLFAASRVVECGLEKNGEGETWKKIRLSPDPQKRLTTDVKEFTVWLDTGRHQIRRVNLVPYRPVVYRQITWTFSNIQYMAAPDDFRMPIEDHVLAANGSLREPFSSYTLDDNRLVTQ